MTVDARRNICPTFTTTTTNNIVRFLRHILPGRISFQRAKVPLPVNHASSSSFFFFSCSFSQEIDRTNRWEIVAKVSLVKLI